MQTIYSTSLDMSCSWFLRYEQLAAEQ